MDGLTASFDRHHVFVKSSHKDVQLAEVGPRFELKREYWSSFLLPFFTKCASIISFYLHLYRLFSFPIITITAFFPPYSIKLFHPLLLAPTSRAHSRPPSTHTSALPCPILFSTHHIPSHPLLPLFTHPLTRSFTFTFTAYEIRLGTVEQTEAETEWVLSTFTRTAKKRKHL